MVRRVGLVTDSNMCYVESIGHVICIRCDWVVVVVACVVVICIIEGVWMSVCGLVCVACVGI